MFGSLEIEYTAVAYRRLKNTGLFYFIIHCFDVHTAVLMFKL